MTPKCWIGVFGTMLGAFMAVLDIQITNSSLRDITGGIGATPAEGSWISTAYLMAEIITIPLTAWLSRVFSIRRYLLINVILFLGFSGLCGIASSLGMMIFFRAGQGFTGGVLIPMSLTVILSTMPKDKVPLGQAMFGLTATLAPAIGPTVGGWLTEHYGWQTIFYINFLPGAVLLAAVWYAIEPGPVRLGLLRNGDWWGIACGAIGLGSLIAMLEEGQRKDWFGSGFIQIAAALAAVFLPAFLLIEWYRRDPFVNLRLLKDRNLSLSCGVAFVLGLGLYGSVYLLPLYLGEVQHYNPLQIGETMLWIGMPQLLVFPFLPYLMKKVDLRLLVCFGASLFAVSCFMNVDLSANSAHDQFIWPNIVRALGQPFTIVPVTQLATGGLAPRDAGSGSAIFNMARNIGGSVGIAILSTLVTRREQFHDLRIGESVNVYSLATQARIETVQQGLIAKGFDPVSALNGAYATIKNVVRRDATIMAYNDSFLFVGLGLVGGALLIWFCRKTRARAGSAAH